MKDLQKLIYGYKTTTSMSSFSRISFSRSLKVKGGREVSHNESLAAQGGLFFMFAGYARVQG